MRHRVATYIVRTAAAVLSAAIPLSLPAAAHAAAVPAIAIDPATGPPLTTIRIIGSGFCAPPCGPVSISVGSLYVANDIAVAADGTFTTFVRVPGTVRPGPVDVAAVQTANNGGSVHAQDTFTVTINQPAPTRYPPPTTIAPPGGLPPPNGPAPSLGVGTQATSPPPVATGAGPVASPTHTATSVATRTTSGNGSAGAWLWVVVAVLVASGVTAAAWRWRRRAATDRR